jgi:hypothetical protein
MRFIVEDDDFRG